MAKEISITKKDIQQLLDGQTKAILNAVDKKIEASIEASDDSMAIMVNTALQAIQDIIITEMKSGFKQVTEQINKINLNAADAVRKEEFDKLEDRVVIVEDALNLKLKRA